MCVCQLFLFLFKKKNVTCNLLNFLVDNIKHFLLFVMHYSILNVTVKLIMSTTVPQN